jgi:SAM-dependent methyltransferase
MSYKEREFWIKDATLEDIDGTPPVNLKQCLDAIIPEIEPVLKELDNTLIFEIGSGTGRLSFPVKKHFKKAQLIGCDISQQFIDIADNRAKKIKEPPIFYKTNKIFLPKTLRNYRYSAVYTMLVFQHLQQMQTYNYILDAGLYLMKGGILRFQYVEGSVDHDNRHDLNRMQVERWLKDAGLEITKLDEGLIHPEWTWVTAVKK